MVRIVTVFILLVAMAATSIPSSSAWAQQAQGPDRGELTGTRRQVATIIFSGLAGAILGLSTLSFYGRPQDHLNNVALGGAVGIIVGTVYTTYKSATRPIDSYDNGVAQLPAQLTLQQELDRQLEPSRDVALSATNNRIPSFQMSWSF